MRLVNTLGKMLNPFALMLLCCTSGLLAYDRCDMDNIEQTCTSLKQLNASTKPTEIQQLANCGYMVKFIRCVSQKCGDQVAMQVTKYIQNKTDKSDVMIGHIKTGLCNTLRSYFVKSRAKRAGPKTKVDLTGAKAVVEAECSDIHPKVAEECSNLENVLEDVDEGNQLTKSHNCDNLFKHLKCSKSIYQKLCSVVVADRYESEFRRIVSELPYFSETETCQQQFGLKNDKMESDNKGACTDIDTIVAKKCSSQDRVEEAVSVEGDKIAKSRNCANLYELLECSKPIYQQVCGVVIGDRYENEMRKRIYELPYFADTETTCQDLFGAQTIGSQGANKPNLKRDEINGDGIDDCKSIDAKVSNHCSSMREIQSSVMNVGRQPGDVKAQSQICRKVFEFLQCSKPIYQNNCGVVLADRYENVLQKIVEKLPNFDQSKVCQEYFGNRFEENGENDKCSHTNQKVKEKCSLLDKIELNTSPGDAESESENCRSFVEHLECSKPIYQKECGVVFAEKYQNRLNEMVSNLPYSDNKICQQHFGIEEKRESSCDDIDALVDKDCPHLDDVDQDRNTASHNCRGLLNYLECSTKKYQKLCGVTITTQYKEDFAKAVHGGSFSFDESASCKELVTDIGIGMEMKSDTKSNEQEIESNDGPQIPKTTKQNTITKIPKYQNTKNQQSTTTKPVNQKNSAPKQTDQLRITYLFPVLMISHIMRLV